MRNNVLFLTLKVFSATGGIEKVCRVAGKSLFEWTIREEKSIEVFCMHDRQEDADDNRYFPSEIFRGFAGGRIRLIWEAVKKGRTTDTVILSHINLLLVGWLIKLFSPKTKLVMFAHGIEIWGELSGLKKHMLKSCDIIVPVSQYTADRISEMHQWPASKMKVLNNCLDPFLPVGQPGIAIENLRQKYGLSKDNIILFTLTRLSSKERYKGYDKVLEALVELKKSYPSVRYLLAGSYDAEEKRHLDDMIARMGLTQDVLIPGFVAEEDLVTHFSMADLYVMPSMKEGFGIVFIEAMFYGLPVIAGNKDGSVDALSNGELGILVDPMDTQAILEAMSRILNNRERFLPDREKLMELFSYEQYKNRFETLLAPTGQQVSA